ncbi:type II toxin-antitoxin system VapC family toxin [Porticoccus sp. GXU_MW_L64]
MSVLVDTSVWVNHFKHNSPQLVELLLRDEVLIHPMILGELACGTPPSPRKQTLDDIGLLRHVKQATTNEVIAFVERERLYGRGCGLVDMTLLASVLITPGASLWTLDKRLAKLAADFGVFKS